jgi:hypothetical protein
VIGSVEIPGHTSSVWRYGATYDLPLAVLGPIILICVFLLLVIRLRSSKVRSELERYAATHAPAGSQKPPEVQAIYDEAKARAAALPRDAQAIALSYRQQVPEPYRENLVRLVFLTAGLEQGMDPRAAIRYAASMWAQTQRMGDDGQLLAS